MNTFRIMTLAGWALSVLAGALGTAAAGSLDSPAAPSSSNSAMFTLEDLYQKLDNQGNAVAPRTNGFTNPAGGPTGGTFRTAADLMALVTNRAAVHKTGVTNIYKANDDGTYQIGVAWPDPRFAMESI